MSYVVTGPLVITKKEDGSDLYVYKDGVLPDYVTEDEAKRLVSLDLVEKVDGRTTKASKPTSESN